MLGIDKLAGEEYAQEWRPRREVSRGALAGGVPRQETELTLILTRPKVLLVALVAVALAATAVLALRSWPSDTLDAASVLSKSHDAQAKILAEATEGKVFHYAMRGFRRHGPADPLIRKMSDEWYLPESYHQELWTQVGPAGKITRVHSETADDQGNLLQEAMDEGETVVIRDVASGAEERLPLYATVEGIAGAVGKGVRDLEEKIDSGGAKILHYGSIDGKRTIVLEQRREPEPSVPEPAPGSFSTGYSLPYTLDLGSVERIERVEIDAETFLPVHSWWVAVDAEGNEYLIEEWVLLANEILDPSAVPAGVFELR